MNPLTLVVAWLTASLVIGVQAQCHFNQFVCSNRNCVPMDYQCDRYNDCGDNSDEVHCACYKKDIRLSNATQGHVELCIQNQSNAICGNVWSSNDAKVVCRQLGFNRSIPLNSSAFGPATTTSLWNNVAGGCTGTEAYLYDCPRGPTSVTCTRTRVAAVRCYSDPSTRCLYNQFVCSNGNCVPSDSQCDRYNDCGDNSDEVGCVCYKGDIRLTGVGSNAMQGNVELCKQNRFNAICGNVWSSNDAKVVCGQLGSSRSMPLNSSVFGPATNRSLWDDVAGGCTGTEKRLSDCPRGPTSVTCRRTGVAGVRCYSDSSSCPSTNFHCTNGLCIKTAYVCDGYDDCEDNSDETNCSCTHGNVKLEGGDSSAEGTVFVCLNNQWRSVCDTHWTTSDAKVVCGQLGYTDGSPVFHSFYGQGPSSTSWPNVGGCIGNERVITECRFTPNSNCPNSQLAGVQCDSSSDRTTDAFIGGAMVGVAGAILLCLFFFICTCTICLCKRGGNCYKRKMPAVPVNAKRYSKINGNDIDVPQENQYSLSSPCLPDNHAPAPYPPAYHAPGPYQPAYHAPGPYQPAYHAPGPYQQDYHAQVPYLPAYHATAPYPPTYHATAPYPAPYPGMPPQHMPYPQGPNWVTEVPGQGTQMAYSGPMR